MRQAVVEKMGSIQVAPETPSRPQHPQILAVSCHGIGARGTNGTQHVCALASQVRMAILRLIGQLALSGFQDRIKGWGLKYVSVQLTLSTYKLVSDGGVAGL